MGLPMTRSETAFSSPASSGQLFLKSKSCLVLPQAKPIVEKLRATSALENLDPWSLAPLAIKHTSRSPVATPDHSRGRAHPLPARRRLLPRSEPCGRTLRPRVCLTDRQPSVERQSYTRRCRGLKTPTASPL